MQKIDNLTIDTMRELRFSGESIRNIARKLNIGIGTVYKYTNDIILTQDQVTKLCNKSCKRITVISRKKINYRRPTMLNREDWPVIYEGSLWKVRSLTSKGKYIYACVPEHPRAKSTSHLSVYEHIIVLENYLGRMLTSEEVVHHINGNGKDNRIENLQLMTRSEHSKLHRLNKYTTRVA